MSGTDVTEKKRAVNINNDSEIGAEPQASATPDIDTEPLPNCVVGIGASAGGLEALQQFLTFLPEDTGMAFVIIQHLSPDHKSLLADILGKDTAMPVVEAQDGMRVRRNHIYMIPPKYNLEIVSDVLRLKEYNHRNINHPIDIFFRSLAAAYENRAVAVILSGTGSDGTNGIRSIKDKNGVIIVQSPESAKFDGMPRNAIATGFVDLVLNPDSIAREMRHIAASMVDAGNRLKLSDGDLMAQVFTILRNVTNVNYTYYKQTTILRRIERRIVVTHNRNLQEYVNYLSYNPDEARLLAKELLIGVTSFFRDPDYFDVLKDRVIYDIVKSAPPAEQIRVWVAGCSTGEEAYSVAILFAEVMEELGVKRDVKIFATDLDGDSISAAGRGVYGDNIIEDVTARRLSRYFSRKGNRYIVGHEIRKMIVFAQHNVFQDPPFGKLDLISCRNLLIYFQNILQRNLFAIFHMALKDRGYLFLGRSESVIDYDDVFRVVCANEKIFIHNASGKAPSHEHITYSMQGVESNMGTAAVYRHAEEADLTYSPNELDTRVLEMLLPASVLVDDKNQLAHSYGDCKDFIMLPVGAVTLDIFSLIRPELKIAVSKALKEARERQERVAYDGIPMAEGDKRELISLVAQPLRDRLGSVTGMTALTFFRTENMSPEIHTEQYHVDTASAERIADLEKELHKAQESLKKTVSELESVNAELQAANEELLTANEELQSSNEELQSVNEELYTVNSEYQTKVNELASLNDDMANFLSTTLVGIIMVDRSLNIRKYTEYISSEFHVADQDVGRSLRYIAFNFATIDLIALCRQVLETMQPIERNCASVAGKTYLLRISPYRELVKEKKRDGRYAETAVSETGAAEDRRELRGLVITFVDTTKQVNDIPQIEEMAKALGQSAPRGCKVGQGKRDLPVPHEPRYAHADDGDHGPCRDQPPEQGAAAGYPGEPGENTVLGEVPHEPHRRGPRDEPDQFRQGRLYFVRGAGDRDDQGGGFDHRAESGGRAAPVQTRDQRVRRPVCDDGRGACGEDPHERPEQRREVHAARRRGGFCHGRRLYRRQGPPHLHDHGQRNRDQRGFHQENIPALRAGEPGGGRPQGRTGTGPLYMQELRGPAAGHHHLRERKGEGNDFYDRAGLRPRDAGTDPHPEAQEDHLRVPRPLWQKSADRRGQQHQRRGDHEDPGDPRRTLGAREGRAGSCGDVQPEGTLPLPGYPHGYDDAGPRRGGGREGDPGERDGRRPEDPDHRAHRGHIRRYRGKMHAGRNGRVPDEAGGHGRAVPRAGEGARQEFMNISLSFSGIFALFTGQSAKIA